LVEKAYWFRLAVIVVMFFGSIYILLPTILQEDPQSRFADSAAAVDAPSATEAPKYEADITFEGDAEQALAVLEARLDAVGLNYNRVTQEEEHLRVVLEVGSSTGDLADALAPKGTLSFYRFADVVDATGITEDRGATPSNAPVPTDLPEAIAAALDDLGVTWTQLQSLAGRTAVPALAAIDGETRRLDAADLDAVSLSTRGLDAGEALLVVAVDGAYRGVAWAPEADALTMRVFEEPASRTAVEAVWVPGAFALVEREEASDEQQVEAEDGEEAEAPSRVPTWVLGLLPNTRMNLGLDLQGGIDLTLQVELDEAVLSQVSRDLTYLKEQAAREGITITTARDDKADPIMRIGSPDALSDLEKWFARGMPDYQYLETPQSGVHVFGMRETRQEQVMDSAVEQVLETLRKRIDATGVKEPSIVKKGGGRINVQLPGMVDLQQAVDAIGTTAVLEFRLVDEEFDEAELQRMVAAAEDALPPEQYFHDPSVNEWLWSTKRLSEERLVMWEYEDTPEGHQRLYSFPLMDNVILTGNDVNNAGVAFDRNNLPYVALEFKPKGSRVFCTVTGEHVKDRFAIILDGEVKSAPQIRERICGGRASIELGSSLDALMEAETLALVLRTGSLNAPVSVGEVRQVGSTLGKDAINAGAYATLIGSILVLVFMSLWYRTAGILANMALGLNVLLVFSVLSLFGATLTLPGIAGVALTIGMAVDANIIIYERIREELKLGQHARKAVETGFEKGVVAVLDANVTTAIAGVVLFSYGTGPIKGFAVTLLIGIATTLTTALFVNRTFMELATRSSTARLRI
jgi:preprotein translocase subunit SecD